VPQGLFPTFGLLDRYLSRIYLRVFAVTFLGMLAVFYVAIFTDYSEYLFKGRTTGQTLLSFFLYSTPQYTYYITAMAALVGTLVTVGLLTRTSELTVMQACGVSLYRAAIPMLAFGFLWSGVLFGMEQSILAASNRRAEQQTCRGVEGRHPQWCPSNIQPRQPAVDGRQRRSPLPLRALRSSLAAPR
jgi:lipopolysaccharide export LptBFGC system permease protein LptF